MSEKYKPSQEEIEKAENTMKKLGLEKRSQAEQDAFEAGHIKGIERKEEQMKDILLLRDLEFVKDLRDSGDDYQDIARLNYDKFPDELITRILNSPMMIKVCPNLRNMSQNKKSEREDFAGGNIRDGVIVEILYHANQLESTLKNLDKH